LVISRTDLQMRILKDIRELMESKAGQKMRWIRDRMIEICMGVEHVSMWDNLQEEFLERVNECSKKYPSASYGAFVKIVNNTAKSTPQIEQIVKEQLGEND
jgi:hypothetical protein